jgi:hypothetical protein
MEKAPSLIDWTLGKGTNALLPLLQTKQNAQATRKRTIQPNIFLLSH